MTPSIDRILADTVAGRRLSAADALVLLQSPHLASIGRAANAVTMRLHPEPYRTYNIDRNINYTNVCTAVCDFCAFYRPPKHAEGYVLDREVLMGKIAEMVSVGGDQILLQGGLHPTLELEWYEELLRDIKARFPQVNVTASRRRRSITSRKSPNVPCGRCSSDSPGPGSARSPEAVARSSSTGCGRRSRAARSSPTTGSTSTGSGTPSGGGAPQR